MSEQFDKQSEPSLAQRLQNLVDGLESEGYTVSANDVREAIAAVNAAPVTVSAALTTNAAPQVGAASPGAGEGRDVGPLPAAAAPVTPSSELEREGATMPETPGSWEERCAALYQVIGSLADFAGVFETSDDVSAALDVACGRGDVENLLPWPKDITHGRGTPSAREEWIPASERLPEKRIRVLTSNALIVEVMYVDWDGKWRFESGLLVEQPNHQPTHWRPLPERVSADSTIPKA